MCIWRLDLYKLLNRVPAVWHLRLDLYKLLKLERDQNFREVLGEISGVRLRAELSDGGGYRATADAHFIAHYSEHNQHLKISTSTTDARAGLTGLDESGRKSGAVACIRRDLCPAVDGMVDDDDDDENTVSRICLIKTR
ncbi:hypothetical protein evm_015254 [Chilo suppressalis]|nr:hypothetical protein evm_015254 [Chilo suppressalis]